MSDPWEPAIDDEIPWIGPPLKIRVEQFWRKLRRILTVGMYAYFLIMGIAYLAGTRPEVPKFPAHVTWATWVDNVIAKTEKKGD